MVFVIIPMGEEGTLRGVQSLSKFAEPKTEIGRHKVRIPWLLVFFQFHHVPIWADIGLLRWKLVSAFSLDCISQTFIGDTEPALTNYSLETLRICLKLEEFSNNGSSELFKVRAGRIMDMQISKGEACIWGKGNEMFKNSNGISHQWFKCWNLSLALR